MCMKKMSIQILFTFLLTVLNFHQSLVLFHFIVSMAWAPRTSTNTGLLYTLAEGDLITDRTRTFHPWVSRWLDQLMEAA